MQLARSTNGRFANGNTGGPGNPLAKRTAHIKRVLLDSVTDDDLRAIVKSLIEQAKGGNAKAAELVLDRLLGKPTTEPLAGNADVELTEAELFDAMKAEAKERIARLNDHDSPSGSPALEERRAKLLARIEAMQRRGEAFGRDSVLNDAAS